MATKDLTKLRMIGFGGASNLPSWLAMEHGIFAKHGLEVSLQRTEGSMPQIQDMMAGKYDLATTSIDNIIAYTEGQGPAKLDKPFDMVAVMGVHSGMNSIVTTPEIKSYADIKGKIVAVDAPNTGYAFVIFRLLEEKAGLKLGRDYSILPVGNTHLRMDAMREGRAVAAVMGGPSDQEAAEEGYNILSDCAAELGGYQGSVYGVRRAWMAENGETLQRFIRAIVEAHGRVYEDKATSKAVLMQRIKGLSDKGAEQLYVSLTAGKGGLARKAEIDLPGMATVLSMRTAYGEPKLTLTDPLKYLDLRPYKQAMGAAAE
jgi:ABC-type nitrate/sulfonate/bicarbonate transport system substrate-binding protein